MCLVLVEKLVAEGGPLFIEGDGAMRRLEVVQGLEQHLGKAVDSTDNLAGLAYGQSHRRSACLEGVVSAVDDSVAIKQNEERLFHS